MDKIDENTNINKEEQVRTTKKKQEFIENFEQLIGIISTTCQKIGIDRKTYYNWMKDDEEFVKKVERAKERQVNMVEDRLMRAILKDNITAIIFYLKNKHPDYINKFLFKGKVQTESKLSDEDKELIKKALKHGGYNISGQDTRGQGEAEMGGQE